MRYLFEGYVLDITQRTLFRGTATVALQPQVFDLLVYIIEERDRVVSKDDILAAVWNGRIVSDSTLASRINALRRALGDTGVAQFLVRTVPRRGIQFVGRVAEENDASVAVRAGPNVENGASVLAPPQNRPSIAVLPFSNLTGDPAQDFFADGVVEEIITELARNPALFVIARNSSFVYKGRAVDARQAGRELGVRYLLEGNVQRSGDRVRVGGQLIDAATGAHLWAGRVEGVLSDIFALEDEIAARVVGAIEPKLRDAEIRRAFQKPTDSLDAHDHVLRALAAFHDFRLDSALAECRSAMASDLRYGLARALAALCIAWQRSLPPEPICDDPAAETEGRQLAREAVACAADDPAALWMAGHALVLLARDYDTALELVERAVEIAPSSAPAWNAMGWTRWNVGDGDRAVAAFERAMTLSPLDPQSFLFRSGVGWAHFVEERYEDAILWADKALRIQPACLTSLRCKLAACGLLDRRTEACRARAAMLELDPAATLSRLARVIPLRNQAHMAAFVDGLRRAGLSD